MSEAMKGQSWYGLGIPLNLPWAGAETWSLCAATEGVEESGLLPVTLEGGGAAVGVCTGGAGVGVGV